MATFYFNGAVDGEWTELGKDDTFTTPAASLPTSRDSVIASASIVSNSGSEPTVVNFTLNDPNEGFYGLGIATGTATFNGNSYNIALAIVNGDATFNGSSSNHGAVNGNATFNGSSSNTADEMSGLVIGNATFNESSSNDGGNVDGNATFNDSSYNQGEYGGVAGDATFTGSSYNNGSVQGAISFTNRTPYPIPRSINGSSILGVI